MATNAGFGPYSAINPATHLIKQAIRYGLLITIKSFICPTLWSISAMDLRAGHSSLNSMQWMVVYETSIHWPLTLVLVSLG